MKVMKVASFDTPLGEMKVGWSERGLTRVAFPGADRPEGTEAEPPDFVRRFVREVRGLLAGVQTTFSETPVDLEGQTAFSKRVYRAARLVRWGETTTYGELATRAGRSGAARAVGGCMARNPVPLIVPCHRVLGSAGSGVGFSAPGGLSLKRKLLALEGTPLRLDHERPRLSPR